MQPTPLEELVTVGETVSRKERLSRQDITRRRCVPGFERNDKLGGLSIEFGAA